MELKTDLSKVRNAIIDLDPKGENRDLSMALFVLSLAAEKEYDNYVELREDALKEFKEYYEWDYSEL